MIELKRTPLYDAHVALGATMVDFGGWEMPIQYPEGIIAEHLYDRKHCGIFDVSHMGRLLVEGSERVAFLQRVLSSNVSALRPGRAQYCIIPNERGGAVDDAYLYMFEEDRYLLVVNASNREKDLAHFAKYLPDYDCSITDLTFSMASIAVQGPESEQLLKRLSGGAEVCGGKKNDLGSVVMEGRQVLVSRTGYTGDPIGFELFIDAAEVNWLWQRLLELGAKATALGARDTLRLEAGLPLYGHELGDDPSGAEFPIFAMPLSRFAVSFAEGKESMVAAELLRSQKEQGTEKRIVPVALVDRGVMRAGMEVYAGDEPVGWITSGTMVPYYNFDEAGNILDSTGKRAIGFAYIKSALPAEAELSVDVRGKRLRARPVARHMDQSQPPYGRAIL